MNRAVICIIAVGAYWFLVAGWQWWQR